MIVAVVTLKNELSICFLAGEPSRSADLKHRHLPLRLRAFDFLSAVHPFQIFCVHPFQIFCVHPLLRMWFQGSVGDAIAKAKTESKLFVVFVGGSDECSKTVCTNLELIGEKIQDKVVAIKLESESENGKHFSQIFPVLIVPSTFVIKNGVPLEIIPKNVDPDEFVAKIESAWSKEVVQNSPVATVDATSEAAASSPTMSPDEKVQLAQKKLAELKAKKAKEEEELERQREASRRETGKAVLNAQKTREEAEMAALMEERRRDKLLEKQAREKVLADIARDREDKKRRLEQQANKAPAHVPVVQVPQPQPIVVGDSARIQFRFPDGHTANKQFRSSETLSAARIFVTEHASLNNFTLSTTYPRRVFTDAESETSLQDLGLVPSAVLMVIPNSDRSNPSLPLAVGSWYTQIPWFFIFPFITIWNLITSFFGGNEAPTTDQTDASRTGTTNRSSPVPSSSGSQPRTTYSRDGNVIRFREHEDSDEDNNTWNGNSTQQM